VEENKGVEDMIDNKKVESTKEDVKEAEPIKPQKEA
jgi:hypothetical protein